MSSPAIDVLTGSLHDHLLKTSDPEQLARVLVADLEEACLLVAPGEAVNRHWYQIQCRLKAEPADDWQDMNGGKKATLAEAQSRLKGVEAKWVKHEYRILHITETITTNLVPTP